MAKYWWINQTTQWEKDHGENKVVAWIPPDRKPHYTHRLVNNMIKDDIMLGFRRQIGVVCWGKITSERAKKGRDSWPPKNKEVDVWSAKVEYHHFAKPISLEKFIKNRNIQSLKPMKYTPINCKDDVIWGYAFRFTKEAFEAVRESQADKEWAGSP